MTDPIFHGVAHFGEREIESHGLEERVVAEPGLAAGCGEDMAFAGALENSGVGHGRGRGDDGDGGDGAPEAGGAGVRGHGFQLPEEGGVVVGVSGIPGVTGGSGGVAGGEDAGVTVQGVDFETGIVGQDEPGCGGWDWDGLGEPLGERAGFFRGVTGEGGGVLDGAGRVRVIGQGATGQGGVEEGLDFADLMAVACGDEDREHPGLEPAGNRECGEMEFAVASGDSSEAPPQT